MACSVELEYPLMNRQYQFSPESVSKTNVNSRDQGNFSFRIMQILSVGKQSKTYIILQEKQIC